MPALPDPHALAIMALTVFALVLFAQDRIALETSSLLVFITLVAGFQIFPYAGADGPLRPRELFAGFGHEALVAVCALMVLGKGLETTGALQPVARILARVWQTGPAVSLLFTMLVAAALSAVVNNTPIVVMLLPILVGVTLSAKASPSGVLLPFGLATVIGGTVTTIGTSTNLLVVSVARDMGVRNFGMFDFALPIALVGFFGILFLWLVAPRLLPQRAALISDKSARLFSAMLYVEDDSKIAGKTLADARKLAGGNLRLLDVQRGERGVLLARLPSLTFMPGDRLLVRDTPERLKELEGMLGTPLHDQETESAEEREEKEERAAAAEGEPKATAEEDAKQRLVEVVVTEDSPLNGSTVRRSRFADEYGLFVLAVHRGQFRDEIRRGELGDVVLSTGDVLLVQGSVGDIKRMKSNQAFLVLDSTVELPDTERAALALGIMGAVIAAAATGLLPISVSALVGVAAMMATRCLTWREASKGLSAQVIMIVVTSLALGTALTRTGATAYVAELFVAATAGMSPSAILGALMLLMAVLTNILSNNAAGIIGTPIAIGIAARLGLAPEPFVIAIIAGVNLSFATPMAYQTNLLVLHAGGYRFVDFVKVGVPLSLLMWAGYLYVIPLFFPF
ncbi:MAG TPA: SLC13 family permease [Burkholderiales bacterium]|nr:SLC13 family permease [Burkholderiales bacterium]